MHTFDVDAFKSQLLEEREKRLSEIRGLKEIYLSFGTDEDKPKGTAATALLKSLFVMLHAHLEGFFKASIDFYITAINAVNLKCKDANHYITTAALNPLFHDLESGGKKDELFKGEEHPHYASVHKHFRRREVVRNLDGIFTRTITIEQEFYVGPNVHFTAQTARETLYVFGFDLNIIDEGVIKKLSHLRNEIAHGAKLKIPPFKTFLDMYETIKQLTDKLIGELVDAFKNRTYLKSQDPVAV